MVRIDKRVEMPKSPGSGRKAKYPWATMEIGDSFILPAPALNNARAHCSQAKIRWGRTFQVREMRDGKFRVWRTA